jgi:hypothetical protein
MDARGYIGTKLEVFTKYEGLDCSDIVVILLKTQTHTYSSKLYQHIRKLGMDSFNIELLEEYPCSNDFEMRCTEHLGKNHYLLQ